MLSEPLRDARDFYRISLKLKDDFICSFVFLLGSSWARAFLKPNPTLPPRGVQSPSAIFPAGLRTTAGPKKFALLCAENFGKRKSK